MWDRSRGPRDGGGHLWLWLDIYVGFLWSLIEWAEVYGVGRVSFLSQHVRYLGQGRTTFCQEIDKKGEVQPNSSLPLPLPFLARKVIGDQGVQQPCGVGLSIQLARSTATWWTMHLGNF